MTELEEETALAMAQSVVCQAMHLAGVSRWELAIRMGRPKSFVSRMLSGRHNMTIKTFFRALSACGYEIAFSLKRKKGDR